uniref:Uncharacterized protein n=1 Tax=Ciona savignyi TaxID=51511 RepID=H2Z909_CIOSA
MEVVYEGEGGSPCAPYITTHLSLPTSLKEPPLEPDETEFSAHSSKSHYIRFQEILHGKKLIKVDEIQPQWPKDTCLPTPTLCACQQSTQKSTENEKTHKCFQFCYVGKTIEISKTDSVWPGLYVEKPKHDTETAKYHDYKFNLEYTNLLQCLETSLNGKPSKMTTCMGTMFELLDAGKRLVATPRYKTTNSPYAIPSWRYIKDSYKLNGMISTVATEKVFLRFC